jgi:hypothetical protein
MGSNKKTPSIIEEIQKWYNQSTGKSMTMDWTVERLKIYKRAVIRYQADESFKHNREFPLKRNSKWIKTDGEGWPKGPLGVFIKQSLTCRDNVDKKLSILLSVLEVSRVFKNKKVTQRQLLKFKEAITGDLSREDIYDFSYKVGLKCSTKFPKIIMNKFKYQYRKHHKFSFAAHSQDLAAASQEVSTDTFGVMVSRFDGKAGAFAYLLFILLYFPCVAALGAMVREVGRGWATIGALWSTGLAYVVAVTFYQTATFSQHPTSSIFWIVFSVALLGVSIYMLMRYGSKTSKTSIPITTISNCRHCE